MKKGLLYVLCLLIGTSVYPQQISAEVEALARKIMSDPGYGDAMENDDEEKRDFPLPNKTAPLPCLPHLPMKDK